MTRYAIAALVLLALAGCEKPAEQSQRAGTEFIVDKLFTVDQCTVYRFADGGRSRYFTNCPGSTSYTESCGKNCTYDGGVN